MWAGFVKIVLALNPTLLEVNNIVFVLQGFEWNKYNQTHYDMDNPPPKIVQGYKFNVSMHCQDTQVLS